MASTFFFYTTMVLHRHHMLFQAFSHHDHRRDIATLSDYRSKIASKITSPLAETKFEEAISY